MRPIDFAMRENVKSRVPEPVVFKSRLDRGVRFYYTANGIAGVTCVPQSLQRAVGLFDECFKRCTPRFAKLFEPIPTLSRTNTRA
jgi:hypothetical protein